MDGKSRKGYSVQRYHLWLCVLESIFVSWRLFRRERTMSRLVLVLFPGHVPLTVVGDNNWTPQL